MASSSQSNERKKCHDKNFKKRSKRSRRQKIHLCGREPQTTLLEQANKLLLSTFTMTEDLEMEALGFDLEASIRYLTERASEVYQDVKFNTDS